MLALLPPAQHPLAPLSARYTRGARRLPGFSSCITDLRCTQCTAPPPRGAHTHAASPAHAHEARSTHTRLGVAPAGLGEDVWVHQSRCHSFPSAFSLPLALRDTGRGLPHAPISRAKAKKLLRSAKSERAELSQPLSNQGSSAFPPACIEQGKSRDEAREVAGVAAGPASRSPSAGLWLLHSEIRAAARGASGDLSRLFEAPR